MGNVYMEASQINYRGGSKKMSVEEAIKAAGTEITPEEKTWIDSIPTLTTGKADNDVIAPEFDSEAGVYAIGDLVMYEGKLYEFTTAHETAGEWDPTEVSEKAVSDEIDTLKSGLNDYNKKAFIVTGHTHATQGMATWDTTGIDFTGRYPVAFYVVNDAPYYVSQAIEGMSISMNATTHEPQLYLHATADAMWKDKDCFAVYI